MAVSLPDVIGEYIDSEERFQTEGIQYAGYFEPATIAPEQVTHLFLFMQNTLNVPVQVTVIVHVPETGGFLRSGGPILKVLTSKFQLKLAEAEAGLLTLPVTTDEYVEEGKHPLTIELKVAAPGKPQRVRSATSQTQLDRTLIDSPVGLNLVSTLGATYTEQSVKKASFFLEIGGQPAPSERAPRLEHKYETIWVQGQMENFNQAIQEINSREVKFQQALQPEAVFAALYSESTFRFAEAGLPLRIGEAIALGKILAYSSHYFLSSSERRNGLLVPIWERALETEADTTDVLDVIRTVGYYHLLKLSVAVSFGLVAQATGQHQWPLLERQAVANHIADSVEFGEGLDLDFLYLPLLMGGTYISNQLKLSGEDPQHSLSLMKKAYDARIDLFADADMAGANQIFNHILTKALQS
jgi:hypothetical protein